MTSEIFSALLIDQICGEPQRFHPLVFFGRCADRLERLLHPQAKGLSNASNEKLCGVLSVAILVLVPVGLLLLLERVWPMRFVVSVLVLYFAVAARSLIQHSRRVFDALEAGNIKEARTCVSYIVSRQTEEMTETDVCRATIESVLENGSDAIFGALFWFAVAGPAGALGYRLINTLDAMWGYRTPRYKYFGWAAARLDDVVSFVPARLTALSYAAVGDFGAALRCWQAQAKLWYSPNAGPVMSAGAGALGVKLGGAARYHGLWKERPELGCGTPPRALDIKRANALVQRALMLWMGMFLVKELF